jgi:hypothetical protein
MCALCITSNARAEFKAQISVVATDLSGNPILAINPGSQFLLQAKVADVRNPEPDFQGVFAAYLNVSFNGNMASIASNAQFDFGSYFPLSRTFDINTAGKILGAGASSGTVTEPTQHLQPLWSVPMTAVKPGVVNFNPWFDNGSGHEVLLLLEPGALPQADIQYLGTSLTIVPEPSGIVLGAFFLAGLLGWYVRGKRSRAA